MADDTSSSSADAGVPWFLFGGRPGGVRDTLWRFATGRFDPEAVLAEARAAREAERAVDRPVPDEGWHALLDSEALAEGDVTEAMLEGVPVALCRVDGVVHVVDNACPHAGGPMGDGDLEGHLLVCPFHGWPFDVRTGRCEISPDDVLTVHEAREADGRIWARSA